MTITMTTVEKEKVKLTHWVRFSWDYELQSRSENRRWRSVITDQSYFDKYLEDHHQCLHQSTHTLRVPWPRSLLKLWGTRAQVPRKSLFWARCIIKTFKVIMIILRGVKYWRSFTKGPTWLRIKQVQGNSPGLDSPSESPRTCFNVFVNFALNLIISLLTGPL